MADKAGKTASSTDESTQDRKLKGLRKFRAVARLAMANRYWLGEIEESRIGGNVQKNIQMLTRKKVKRSSLSVKEKAILCKPKEERTDEEKLILNKVIGGLKCFRRYPPNVKSQLAAVTYFVYFGAGRQIVKQDHVPLAMYFVLSGEASVTVRHYDKFLDEWSEEDAGILMPGTMFGEVALIHGIVRLATITTITPCELLMIKKEDFDMVLKETVMKSWMEIQKILNEFSYFKNWDTITKRECCILARTKSFEPDDTLLGDGAGLPAYVHFITKGSCCIIENLDLMVYNVKGTEKYRLLEKRTPEPGIDESKEASSPSDKLLQRDLVEWPREEIVAKNSAVSTFSVLPSRAVRTETHFIKVCELSAGACFNVGENLNRRRVVAVTPTSCLLVPRYWIMRNNIDNQWNRVLRFLDKHVPSSQQIFENFMQQRRFEKYKKRLMKDLLAEKRVANNNSIHNVPYSIRLTEELNVKYS